MKTLIKNKILQYLRSRGRGIFPVREFLNHIKLPENCIGAEVGVYKGDNSLMLLKKFNFRKLDLMVSWNDWWFVKK